MSDGTNEELVTVEMAKLTALREVVLHLVNEQAEFVGEISRAGGITMEAVGMLQGLEPRLRQLVAAAEALPWPEQGRRPKGVATEDGKDGSHGENGSPES